MRLLSFFMQTMQAHTHTRTHTHTYRQTNKRRKSREAWLGTHVTLDTGHTSGRLPTWSYIPSTRTSKHTLKHTQACRDFNELILKSVSQRCGSKSKLCNSPSTFSIFSSSGSEHCRLQQWSKWKVHVNPRVIGEERWGNLKSTAEYLVIIPVRAVRSGHCRQSWVNFVSVFDQPGPWDDQALWSLSASLI